jgi:hypothetical protein
MVSDLFSLRHPAEAGTDIPAIAKVAGWVPAFAGMTSKGFFDAG